MSGSVDTVLGPIPQVSSELDWKDRVGTVKVRWGVGRMRYTVEPGLYALGTPDEQSPVLVTANYKLSFDRLRTALPGRSAWVLVLDTQGINVWCAAGKGTFGTGELVSRIQGSRVPELVSHRQLILPQLSGPGVAAHQVQKLTGFRVIFGPIRSEDLPEFLDNGLQATRRMRKKRFPLGERVVLIPVELVSALKWTAIISLGFLILSGWAGDSGFWQGVVHQGIPAAAALLGGVLAGAVLTPILLPWLPGRAFTTKGLAAGLAVALALVLFQLDGLRAWQGMLEAFSWVFMTVALSAYLAMNFTGASTFTSLSGVRKEMRWAVPVEISAAGIGILLWLTTQFVV